MRKFVCGVCNKPSYSSAALEFQRHPECIYCGANACKEVPMTDEDIRPLNRTQPKVTVPLSVGSLRETAGVSLLNDKNSEVNSLVEDDSAIAAAWLLMIYCHQHGTLHQNNACEGCVLASMINCSGISPERPDPLWNWDVPNPLEVGIQPEIGLSTEGIRLNVGFKQSANDNGPSGIYRSNQLLWPCDPNLNVKCRKSGCYVNGGPCKHTTNPVFAIPGTEGVPAKELLVTQFGEVNEDGN